MYEQIVYSTVTAVICNKQLYIKVKKRNCVSQRANAFDCHKIRGVSSETMSHICSISIEMKANYYTVTRLQLERPVIVSTKIYIQPLFGRSLDLLFGFVHTSSRKKIALYYNQAKHITNDVGNNCKKT